MGGPPRSADTEPGGPTIASAARPLSSVPPLLDEWQLSLCGDVVCTGPDGRAHPVPGTQAQLVLAYLVVEDRPVQRDELAELLWEGPLPDHWAGAVRGLVTKVRAVLLGAGLPEDCLVTNRGILRLHLPPAVRVDVRAAEVAVDLSGRARSLGNEREAVALAHAARETLRSLFLPRGDGAWVRQMRDRLHELARVGAHHEIEALLALDDAAGAAHRAETAVSEDPLDETAHHLLLRALIADGQQVRALAAYEHLRDLLATEFGIRPAAATEALYLELLEPSAPANGAPEATSRARPSARDTGPHSGQFVGRAREIDQLVEARDALATGRPRIVVVTGEAGIGKTRLAFELSERWRGQEPSTSPGASGSPPAAPRALWGRCRVDAGLPYEPLAEALLEHLSLDGGANLRRIGFPARGLLTLLPELAPLASAEPAPAPSSAAPHDAAITRAQLFRSVAAVLHAVCVQPTLLVIDDAQWASEDTVALLEYVLDGLDAPLLVVLTMRDAPPAIDAALARLQRRVPIDTLALTGLDEHDIAPLVADLAARAGGDAAAVARTVARRTGGNPFLITEIAKDATGAGTADPFGTPAAVRAWIERRAAALPPATSSLLDLAAVIGLEIDFDVLLASNPADEAELLERLEELIQAGLLAEADAGHFAFPHAITRDAVYDRMGATRRMRLHRRVAAAYADAGHAGRASVLTHHFSRAGEAWRAEAFAHALEAGRESLDRAAWSLASTQLSDAVDLAAEVHSVDASTRAELLALLGRARHGTGDAEGARAALEDAIALARQHALPRQLALAVLHLVGGGGRGVAVGLPDAERAALLREALGALLDGTPTPDRADAPDAALEALAGAVEGELALALLLTEHVEEREALVQRSLHRAREATERRGTPDSALAQALLSARIALVGPHDVRARLAHVDEVLALPSTARSPEQTLAALVHRHEDLLLLGDRAAASAALTQVTTAADEYAHPYWRWVTATWWTLAAIIDGRLDEAEALAFEATTRQIGDHPEAFACLGVNLIDIRLYQGRAGELLDLVEQAADENPHIPCYRAVLALCAAEAGELDRAGLAYGHFARDGFGSIPRDTNRLLTLGVLAHTATALGRSSDAPALLALLAPYSGQHIVLNCFGGGGAAWGPVDHQLGRLAQLEQRDADAARLLAAARDQARSFAAPLATARIDADLARLSTR